MELKITSANFEKEVLNSDIPVVVDFFAQWCGPCKMMAPIIGQLAEEFAGKCKIGKCDIDEDITLAQKYRVMQVPTLVFFKNGEVVGTSLGVVSKNDLAAKISQLL